MITVSELKRYLDKCPEDAIVKIGIGEYEAELKDILKSPISNTRVVLVDDTYLKDCSEV